MSFVFSKNKEKRSRSATGESNSSFVKNVTSRVSGLLPAGITKWFSSPSSSSANGSVAIAEGTDSSTEDEAPESPNVVQPPAKRIRYSSPVGRYSHLTTSETTTTSNIVTETGSVLYSSIQSPSGHHNWREPNFALTPIKANDTHTYMNSNTMNTNTMVDKSEIDNSFMQHSTIGQSVKRKSLFDTPKQKEQSLIACAQTAAHQVKDPKQPHFNPHLLGSPFYPGRTMYGGSSASSTYMSHPNIKHQKMAYVNESQDTESVMSTSSRRVMDLLENYSSPLIEAKRIPRYELSELRDINKSLPLSTNTSSRFSYKTQEMYVPTTASLIRMKARNRLMESTKAARQIIASHSSTYSQQNPYNIDVPKLGRPNNELSKSQSKLKSRLTRINRGDDALEMPENVDLPTAVLQIDKNNLPKFSLGSTPTTVKPNSKTRKEAFKFSIPLEATPDAKAVSTSAPTFNFDSPETAAENDTPPKFSFMKQYETTLPIRQTQSPPEKKDEPDKLETEKTVISFAKSNSDWKCSDCWVSNKAEAQKCACCGAKQPSKLAAAPSEATPKCTSCKLANCQPNSDRCVNCEKMRANIKPINSLPVLVSKNTNSKWKCDGCWVDNEESAEKCICCGSRNPRGPEPSTPHPPVSTPGPAVSAHKDWRCKDCFITNKPTTEKCAACGGTKPGTKTFPKKLVASTNDSKPDSKMAEIIKAQQSYWECAICLASNANDKPTCMCCDAPRDPQQSEPSKFTNFKFNADFNSGFKFGIDPKDQEKNLSKKVEEKPKLKILEESETNNNVVPKLPSFGITTPTIKQSDSAVSTKSAEEPKPSFSFGIPQKNTLQKDTPLVATGFGSHSGTTPAVAKMPDIVKPADEKEKPQEVPSIPFTTSEFTKPSTGLFSSQSPPANPQNAMKEFLTNSAVTTQIASSKPSVETAAPKFSFSAGPVKPRTDLFTVPAPVLSNSFTTQAATGSSHAMEMFPKPDPSVVTATSIFTKPETNPAPASSLFSNNAASSTIAAAPPAASSLFSFVNNPSSAAAPATDAKKFSFSFGSSTTTPAFGATTQTSSTFCLPTGNQLTNGPTNPLGGSGGTTNRLSITGNPLGGTTAESSLIPSGNGMIGSGSTPMFGAPAKDNASMWPSSTDQTNQSNPFMSSTAAKPFSFGATPAPSPFGSQPTSAQPPAMFGASAQPAQNIFVMNQSNGNQPSMFGSPAGSQPAPMFAAAPMTMFGAPSASPFGAPAASMPAFEAPAPVPAPATAPAPAPAFSFGVQQSSPVIFGFGQQPQSALCMPASPSMQVMEQPQMQGMQQPAMQQPAMQQPSMQQQQPGMFFGTNASPGQMQFTVGSAPSMAGRKLRKAVRRTQR